MTGCSGVILNTPPPAFSKLQQRHPQRSQSVILNSIEDPYTSGFVALHSRV